MNQLPLVSIIIPSFNQAKFIEETICSVLAQKYRPIEIIIVDAQSTDGTVDILRKFDNCAEITWITEPDNGHADGINKGFSMAKGEIVAWLNSDDVYFSHYTLDIVVQFFKKRPAIDVLYGDVAIISEESKLLRVFLLPKYIKERIQRGNFISQPAVFFQKHVVEAQKLDDHQIGLDYEYWLRLGLKGYSFFHVNNILAADRHYIQRVSVIKKDTINSQIAAVKSELGLSPKYESIMYLVDRFAQAICRVKGLIIIILLPIFYHECKKHFAFPAKLDSFFKLFLRQLTKSIGTMM